MATLSREQTAQLLYNVGFRGDELATMVAVAGAESSYQTDAHRTDRDPSRLSGDRGLFQINYIWDDELRRAGIISSASDLFDPMTNARAARFIYERQGVQAWDASKRNWNTSSSLDAARQAVERATSSGLISQSFRPIGTGSGTPSSTNSGPVQLPRDVQVYNIAGTYDIWATFNLGNVTMAYKVDTAPNAVDWKSHNVSTVSRDQWSKMGVVTAGNAEELRAVGETFGTFRGFWDSVMAQVMGPFNPARNDPEVIGVMAEFAARPDMEQAELANKLQATTWFRSRTEEELEWNGLSPAEQQQRRDVAASQAVQTIFQYYGDNVDPSDPRVANYLEDLAIGKLGWGAYSQIIRKGAAGVEESTWARQIRDEKEAKLQRGIDIENSAQQIRQTLDRWGLSWTNDEIMTWARNITENESSDDDLMTAIQAQAATLYPWKDPKMETLQAAQPWLSTYERVMEKTGSIRDPQVQKALTSGTAVYDFEKELKRSDEWLTTKNGINEISTIGAEVGRRMGFV